MLLQPIKVFPGIRDRATKQRGGEGFKDRIGYAGTKGPNCRRKRRIEWAIWPERWQQCDVQVRRCGECHPPQHGAEDGAIDIEEINEEAGEEEEEGKMYHGR